MLGVLSWFWSPPHTHISNPIRIWKLNLNVNQAFSSKNKLNWLNYWTGLSVLYGLWDIVKCQMRFLFRNWGKSKKKKKQIKGTTACRKFIHYSGSLYMLQITSKLLCVYWKQIMNFKMFLYVIYRNINYVWIRTKIWLLLLELSCFLLLENCYQFKPTV